MKSGGVTQIKPTVCVHSSFRTRAENFSFTKGTIWTNRFPDTRHVVGPMLEQVMDEEGWSLKEASFEQWTKRLCTIGAKNKPVLLESNASMSIYVTGYKAFERCSLKIKNFSARLVLNSDLNTLFVLYTWVSSNDWIIMEDSFGTDTVMVCLRLILTVFVTRSRGKKQRHLVCEVRNQTWFYRVFTFLCLGFV